jgi:glycosyltransferase involved in cell wall biosynthesis
MPASPPSDARIALNLLYLLPGQVGGTETYAAGLIGGFATLAPPERFIVLVNRDAADWPLPAGFTRVVCDVSGAGRGLRYAFEQLRLPGILRQVGADLVHSLGYVSPLFTHCPRVVSIHDLNYLAFGDEMPWSRRQALRFFIGQSARRAALILTLSGFSRGQIIRHLGISETRVRVVHLAAGTSTASTGPPPVDGPYLLAFGSRSPNKNLDRLVEAYRASGAAQRLVIAGHVPAHLQTSEDGRIVCTGYLGEVEKDGALAGADALVFPSTYEGFGLPVLEAMQAGVPVISSSAAALPEVGGDAACYFDPRDLPAMAARIREVAGDAALRGRMRDAGLARAASFSWRQTAEQTLATYRAVLAS